MNPETNSTPSDQSLTPSKHRPLLGFVAVGLGLALTLFALLWPARPSANGIAPSPTRAVVTPPSGCTRNLASAGSGSPAQTSGCCSTPAGKTASDACEMHGDHAKQPGQTVPPIKAQRPGVPHE